MHLAFNVSRHTDYEMTLSTKPVFIIGAPRSGTTLMRSIVDAHPQLFCPPWETGIFVRLEQMLNGDLPTIMRTEAPHFPVTREDLVA